MTLGRYIRSIAVFIAFLLITSAASAYGISGHLRVVYENWDDAIAKPIGHTGTATDIILAASIGALISDIGYLLPAPQLQRFSSAVHYLHSSEIARHAMDMAKRSSGYEKPRRLAFAAGLATHYWADRYGHYLATNRIVADVKRARKEIPERSALRFVYENDAQTHAWVEARAIYFDWNDASDRFARMADEFIRAVHEPELRPLVIDDLAQFIQAVLNDRFSELRIQLTALDLLHYLQYAARLLCAGLQADSAGRPMKQSLLRVLRRCDHLFTQKGLPSDTDTPGLKESLGFITKPLAEASWEKTYEKLNRESHLRVAKELKDLPLPPFNLDTNLLAAAGTYRQADFLVRDVAGDPASAFPDYMRRGTETRAYFKQRITSAKQAMALLSAAELDGKLVDWLFDIFTNVNGIRKIRVVVQNECAGKPISLPGRGSVGTRASGSRTVCVRKGTRFIELLYALGLAGAASNPQAQPEGGWRAAYLEARDRLRLAPVEEKKIDSKTGMYPLPTGKK